MEGKSTVKSVSKGIALYAIWIVFTVSQIALSLWIHDLIFSAALLLAKNAWVPRAVDMWSMFLLGMVVLGAIFVTESYLSKGMQIKRFWYRVGMVALIEAIIAMVLLAIQYIIR